jgi:SAM-dependent methyltransferase
VSFRYDGSGIDRIYDAARALTADARELWAQVILEYLAREPVRRALDLGCGTGRFAALLGEVLSATVVGVDPSADMLGRAAAKPELVRVRLIRAAAEALPLRARAVDLVFVHLAYHHFADRSRALAECARVLVPGGRLMLSTPTLETLPSFLWMRFFPGAEAIDRRRMPGRAALIETARGASLDLARMGTVRRPFTAGVSEYIERVGMRSFSTLQMVSDAEFEAGMRDLRRYAGGPGRDEVPAEETDVFVFRTQRAA